MASALKRLLFMLEQSQVLSLLAVENDLSGVHDVAGLTRRSLTIYIMLGIISFVAEDVVFKDMYMSLKHKTVLAPTIALRTLNSTSSAEKSISSLYMFKTLSSTSLALDGVIAFKRRFSKAQKIL